VKTRTRAASGRQIPDLTLPRSVRRLDRMTAWRERQQVLTRGARQRPGALEFESDVRGIGRGSQMHVPPDQAVNRMLIPRRRSSLVRWS
jgi:hypothetical protein